MNTGLGKMGKFSRGAVQLTYLIAVITGKDS
jgi:hypothetical protein